MVNLFTTVGRGSSAVDLNTVPGTALESVEVLRDGAAAQYGSDAIAGVINLRLREARSGGGLTVDYGFYDTQVNTANGSRNVTGEHAFTVSGWKGFGFGDDGYLTVSGDYQDRSPTSRGDFDQRLASPAVTSRFGEPRVEQYTGYLNFGTSISDAWKAYGWVGYQYRKSDAALLPRLASVAAANDVGNIYPNGFLPLVGVTTKDFNSAVGLKGDIAGWNVDANVSYGRNNISLRTLNSANYTYGANSQTDFYDGSLSYDQLIGGVDVDKKLDVLESLNIAFGVEGRREGYEITAGEYASYGYGPASTTRAPGAQAFIGFSPENAVNVHRTSVSAYVDLEAEVTSKLSVGVAGRAEHFSDFGNTVNGKLSARYEFAPWFALRGTASTGFRAPSLQQSYYTSTSSVLISGASPLLTGTYPATSAVAQALGAKALEPEKSTNLSIGTVLRGGGFDLTLDAYRIHIRDQISLSENLTAASSPQIAALLAPYNVSAARFFINGLATTTKGIDLVIHYRLRDATVGVFDFTVAGNVNKATVTAVPSIPAATNTALFARTRIKALTDGTPGEKLVGSLDWSLGEIGATARVTYYGNVLDAGTDPSLDYYTGARAITDFELRYEMKKGLRLAFGANNLFDVYPKAMPSALNPTGLLAFSNFSPFGFNGRYLYVRAGMKW
jgi:iron complex outermembrane receptor protein